MVLGVLGPDFDTASRVDDICVNGEVVVIMGSIGKVISEHYERVHVVGS